MLGGSGGFGIHVNTHILVFEGVGVHAPLKAPYHNEHEERSDDLRPLSEGHLRRIFALVNLLDKLRADGRNDQQH